MTKTLINLYVVALLCSALYAQQQQKMDLTNPATRKMILQERKSMNCAGIYEQTRRKFSADLKVTDKFSGSVGVNNDALVTLTELATVLGQKRRDFCEMYRVTPEMMPEDYFRAFGELNKTESDLTLLVRVAKGQASPEVLKNLQTIPPAATGQKADLNASARELTKVVDSVDVRVKRAEEKINQLEQQSTQEAQDRKAAEERRRTPPKLDAYLTPVGAGRVRVTIVSENLIPFEFRYVIVTKPKNPTGNGEIVAPFALGMAKIYPNQDRKVFSEDVEINNEKVQGSYLELRFVWRSLVADELNLPGHTGEIVRKYKVANNYAELVPAQ